MLYRPDKRILTDEFINTFLITAAEEVEFFRSDQPDYSAFEKQRSSWNNTLSGLGESLLREYDSAVHRAFIDYQELLENYFIVKGLTEGLGGQIKPPPEGEASAIPGLEEAERRLRLACRQFVGRLDEKAGAQCVKYLQVRKQIVDTGGALCQRCGAELAEELLRKSGLLSS